jgi:hypothetical protein
MVRLYVRHSVQDYGVWREHYDAFDSERQGFGVVDHAVYQAVDDPNDVTLWHDFGDLDTARAFVDSERLREVMGAAGVVGEPQLWFVRAG